METKKLYFTDSRLAGRKYHDADEVWEQLRVGTLLRLERDRENRTDANAVMVVFQDKEGEVFKLGYIPHSENETIANLLEMGWTDIFECRISKLNPDAHPENQVHLTIKIKKNVNQ